MADIKGKCDTCGTDDVDLYVYALPGIPMTVANCLVCMQLSCYPYGILVANTAMVGGLEYAADWWKDEVRVSLARHGKSVKEFVEDVKKSMADMDSELGPPPEAPPGVSREELAELEKGLTD